MTDQQTPQQTPQQPPQGAQELHELDGERGMPSVNEGTRSGSGRGIVFALFVLIIGIAVFVGWWKFRHEKAAPKAEKQTDMDISTNAVPPRTFSDVPPPRPAAPPPAPVAEAQPIAVQPVQTVPAPQGGAPALPGSPGAAGIATLDKSGSSLMAKGGAMAGVQADTSGVPAVAEALRAANEGDKGGALGGALASTQTQLRRASKIGNRNFLLTKGSFIDCALQTKLDSTVPGMTACVVTRNIFSDNGKVLLVERGSQITGEYQSNMRQGMARIFVLWSRIKTPNGVIIPLDSPGTDQLGGAGVPGYIDNHFWQRFGGALLLSLVDDVATGVANSTQGSGNQNFNFGSTQNATTDMAAEALKNTINIPPTLYKNQGEQVGIYVARDLDFSSVYDVAAE